MHILFSSGVRSTLFKVLAFAVFVGGASVSQASVVWLSGSGSAAASGDVQNTICTVYLIDDPYSCRNSVFEARVDRQSRNEGFSPTALNPVPDTDIQGEAALTVTSFQGPNEDTSVFQTITGPRVFDFDIDQVVDIIHSTDLSASFSLTANQSGASGTINTESVVSIGDGLEASSSGSLRLNFYSDEETPFSLTFYSDHANPSVRLFERYFGRSGSVNLIADLAPFEVLGQAGAYEYLVKGVLLPYRTYSVALDAADNEDIDFIFDLNPNADNTIATPAPPALILFASGFMPLALRRRFFAGAIERH